MFSQFINPFLRALLFIAIIALSLLFKAQAQSSTHQNDQKIHLKIMKDFNGNKTEIDTVFDNNEAADNFLKQFNDENEFEENDINHQREISIHINGDSLQGADHGAFNFNFKIPEWSETDREKMEAAIEELKKEIELALPEGDFKFDTTVNGNKFNYNFKFNCPDRKEMEQMEKELNNMKFDFDFNIPDVPPFPPMPPMPPAPNFKPDVNGLNDADLKQFNDQMKKAEEEYKKALELLKEKNGTINQQHPCPGFYHYEFNDNNTEPARKKIVIIKKSDSKNSSINEETQAKKEVDKSEKSNRLSLTNLKIFPNPGSGQFEISFNLPDKGDTEISITDPHGKNVYKELLASFSGNYQQSFDISDKGKGVYLLTITQNNKSASEKLIVK